jgi:phosphoglycolate phosphatase-like HAD superfamily hydrolase
MKIEAVLFDADGVVQTQTVSWREALAGILGSEQEARLDEFMRQVFAAERPSLIGRGDFTIALAAVLREWQCEGTVDDALSVWTMIDVYTDITDVIRRLRRSGIRCGLATNQQSHRAAHMSSRLKYSELFDWEFYSCQVGAMNRARAGQDYRTILHTYYPGTELVRLY